MAKDKSSVLLYRDIIHTVEKLDDVTAGLLFKHYLRYINDLEPETDNPIVEIAFESIKQNLKRDLKSYEKTCEKNRENAYIRWGKKDATASDRIRVDAKHADTDTDKDTDKDIDKDKDKEGYRKFKHLSLSLKDYNKLLENFTKKQIDTVLDKIENYSKNKNYTSLYLTSLNWLKDSHKEKSEIKEDDLYFIDPKGIKRLKSDFYSEPQKINDV